MTKNPILFIIIFLLISLPLYSQNSQSESHKNKSKIEFLPSQELFRPIKASIFEPRISVAKNLNNDYLKLDIGYSPDIVSLKKRRNTYSVGVEFFTFSNLRNEDNFKFPVDAIDYYFGLKFSYQRPLKKNMTLSGRLRIAHISSHFEDGHKYERTDTIFIPVIYSREFVDLSAILDTRLNKRISLRNQLSINFLFHSIPDDFAKVYFQHGFEANFKITRILSAYFSNELRLVQVKNKWNLNSNIETGIKIGKLNSRGVNLFFTYYDGQDYKGQYYEKHLNIKALGFSVDL
ncbi:MAG TPA: DUF1207 domain-containing protein [Ignavibacteria bacterium]|nr:DUF1207 domain-containing protein [Ignavibacteria bacterium]